MEASTLKGSAARSLVPHMTVHCFGRVGKHQVRAGCNGLAASRREYLQTIHFSQQLSNHTVPHRTAVAALCISRPC